MIKYLILTMMIISSSFAAKSTFGTIATASKNGTYIKIGNDISKVFEKYNAELKVLETGGSVENIDILLGKEKEKQASWAIVQADALKDYEFTYFTDSHYEDELYNKLKIVLPLYSEHIHIIAKKGNGKNISFKQGSVLKVGIMGETSGSRISARIIEHAYGINFKYNYFSFKEALKALKDEKIDIIIDVISLPNDKYKKQNDLELVNLPKNKTMDSWYQKTVFDKSQYKWLEKNIQGYKVPSVIITNKVATTNDKFVEIFLKIILKEYKTLMLNGHPKWKEAYKNLKYIYNEKFTHPMALKVIHRKY